MCRCASDKSSTLTNTSKVFVALSEPEGQVLSICFIQFLFCEQPVFIPACHIQTRFHANYASNPDHQGGRGGSRSMFLWLSVPAQIAWLDSGNAPFYGLQTPGCQLKEKMIMTVIQAHARIRPYNSCGS